jgi:hypothetical protein
VNRCVEIYTRVECSDFGYVMPRLPSATYVVVTVGK